MRTSHATVAAIAALALGAALPSLATVNHGNFSGTGVDFNAVSETTTTVGDPEPIWGPPTLSVTGTQLFFSPPSFISSCSGPSSDVTSSTLTTTVQSQSGVHIEVLALQEAGDASLDTFEPFGTPATNTSAAISGTVTVLEDVSGPIAPVVIPFTGTFIPSSSFALPINFGVNGWKGNISVDVASAVPNATKVEVSLTNSLAANCGPGATSALIQKKAVSGPAVALAVNPLPCDLEVEKTCCVTQPPLPDLDSCDGQLVRLLLEYTGDKCMRSSCDQGGAFQCLGHRRIGEPASINLFGDPETVISPDSGVHYGDVVELSSSDGTLPAKSKLKVYDSWWRKQILKLDTSCNRAIACGDQFGAFKVVGLESTLGGVVDCNAPPPPPQCVPEGSPPGTPCDDKVVDMVLEYQGQACQVPLPNPQGGYAKCSGNATGADPVGIVYTGQYGYKQTVIPSSGIHNGDRVRVTSTQGGGLNPVQSFKITDSGGVRQKIDMKVSCEKPFALGDQFGSLKVVEFTTKTGFHAALGGAPEPKQSCEVPLAPPGPHCTSDLQGLTLVYIGNYLGAGCTVSNPQGGYGTCSGVADPGDPVSVAPASGLTADPDDLIEFGDLVTLTKTSSGDLPDFTGLTVTGAGGSQTLQIKTSCYKPLSLGDRFGSFVVFGMDREDDGPISLGGNIQYQYEVTNPNASQVDNVQISDDQIGTIASGVSIPAGGSQTFVQNATLYGTTTNVATVTGDVNGDICNPGVDQLTVNVTAPPQGAFSCSDPIHELTLIWNGSQIVDVKAWAGNPGTSTMLEYFQDVDPGDAITVSGVGPTLSTLEIFNSAGTTKIGESRFDLTCNDSSMNSLEDCGKNIGNLKYDWPFLNNDWLLEGMADSDETLACTPGLVPNPPACGIGPELILVLPGLLIWHRRRLRKEA